jgi:hypothetical protein
VGVIFPTVEMSPPFSSVNDGDGLHLGVNEYTTIVEYKCGFLQDQIGSCHRSWRDGRIGFVRSTRVARCTRRSSLSLYFLPILQGVSSISHIPLQLEYQVSKS